MRTFSFAVLLLLFSALAVGQSGVRNVPGYCSYGCGPYIPLVTTPIVSLQTVSPSPVGASNATGGLLAGARNSTLSMVNGNASAVYTEPVWYSGGGSPMVAPAVKLPHEERGGMHEERAEQREGRHGEEARQVWTYYSGQEQIATAGQATSAVKGAKRAARTYTNQDVERMNQQNGQVKYDGKTEKIQ
jgi:hypothetical protein